MAQVHDVDENDETESVDVGHDFQLHDESSNEWLESEYSKSFVAPENVARTHKTGWFFSVGVLLNSLTYISIFPGWTGTSIAFFVLILAILAVFQLGTRLTATQKYHQESAVTTVTLLLIIVAVWLTHNCNSAPDRAENFDASFWQIDPNNVSAVDVVELLDWAKTWYQGAFVLMIFVWAMYPYSIIGFSTIHIQHRIARPGQIVAMLIPALSFIAIAATKHAAYNNAKLLKLAVPILFVYLFTASVFLYASEMNAVKRKRLWRHEHVLDLRVQALQAEHDAHVERHEQLVVKTEGGLETEAAMRDLLKDKGEHGLFALYVKAMSGSETASKVLKAFLISHRAQSNAQATQTGKKGDTVHMMEMSVAATAIEVGTAWMERLRAASKGGGFRKQNSDATEAPGIEVFLGGSCNPTTWRKEVAIPMFEKHGIRYYNPQVEEWTEELTAIEGKAKEAATVQLFIVDGQTRAMAAILEATEYLCRGRVVVLAVLDIPNGSSILGEKIGVEELKDLNRARSYLRESAARHGVPTYPSVTDACEAVCRLFVGQNKVVVHIDGNESDSTLIDDADGNGDGALENVGGGSGDGGDGRGSRGADPIADESMLKKTPSGKSYRKMTREESVITRFKVESMRLHTQESWARARALTKSLSRITSGSFGSGAHTLDLAQTDTVAANNRPPPARQPSHVGQVSQAELQVLLRDAKRPPAQPAQPAQPPAPPKAI